MELFEWVVAILLGPLLTAIYHEDVQAVDRLIAAGANVRAANREGVTPLAMACLDGNLPIVERLLKAGADPKQPCR